MGWLGRGLGQFGSEVGQGYDINLGWKERLQEMAMRNAQQKLADLKGPLEIQEIQQRLRQMRSPQPAGIVKGVGGETSGVTFDPQTSTYSIKTLIPGTPLEPKFATLQAAAAYYLQKGDFEKLKLVNDEIDRTRTQKTTTEKPDTQIFGGYRWQFDPGNKILGRRDSTGQWVRLGPAREPGTEKTSEYDERINNWLAANKLPNTPENRDKADQSLGIRNKQNDRVDALKAVTNAMTAFKNVQSQITTSQRIAGAWSMWKPGTWGSGSVAQANIDAAKKDYEEKRQDAIQKLQDAGMPVPPWLATPAPGSGAPPPPPEQGLTVVPGAR